MDRASYMYIKAYLKKLDTGMLWSLFLAVVVRGLMFPFSKNYDGDAPARVLMSVNWLHHPSFILGTNDLSWVWPPLPIYLIGFTLSIFDNIQVASRLTSLIFGSISIFPFYKIVQMKFGKSVAVISSIIFSFYTLHVRYSTVATSEAVFLFTVLMSVFFLLKYEQKSSYLFLLASAVFLNLAAMSRHETPLFVVILSFLLFLIARKKIRTPKAILLTLAFAMLSLVYTDLWYSTDYRHYGEPLYAINVANAEHRDVAGHNAELRGTMGNTIYNLAFWPAVLILSLSPLVALLAFMGFIRALYHKEPIALIALFIIPYIIYNISSSVFGSMTPFARFSMVFAVFLIPFGGNEWQRMIQSVSPKKKIIIQIILVMNILLSFALITAYGREGRGFIRQKLDSVSPASRLPIWIDEVNSWVNGNARAGDIVLMEEYKYEFPLIVMNLDLRPNQIVHSKHFEKEIADYADEGKSKYLICSPEGPLLKALYLDDKVEIGAIQENSGIQYTLRFKNSHYLIFEIIFRESHAMSG